MKKIKVLQFPVANNKSGITKYTLSNWEYIDKSKIQFDFATMSNTFDFEDELKFQGCKLFHISCYAEDNETQFIDEMNEILENGYDVVHLHTSCWKSFLVEKLAKQHCVPKIIVHSHNSMVLEENEERRKKALILHEFRKNEISQELATDFWACSHVAADWLFGNQIPKEKIVIMKNSINVEIYKFDDNIRLKYRKELGVENDFVIGNVGRFVYQKNHEFLIDVFIEVKKYVKNTKLILVGVGPLEGMIRQKLYENNLLNDVIIFNRRNDINNLMQAMDIFCLPSRFEGLPITLIEAQCSGLKCFASDCISREARITDNLKFILLNKTIWADEIIKNVYRCSFRENMSKIVAEAGYNIKDQIKIIENLYINGCENESE